MRPPMPPTFRAEEIKAISELEEETVHVLETRSECFYDTNDGLGTGDHLRDEVWDEFVSRAKAAGYDAHRSDAIVAIRNPKA